MFVWAGIFLVLAIIVGYFGFKRSSDPKVRICKILFFLFLIGFVLTLATGIIKMYLSPVEMVKSATKQFSPY